MKSISKLVNYNIYMIFLQNLALTAPWILLAYLIGSLNFALIFSKTKYQEDIRQRGSGNAGATNVRRNYGSKWGYFTGVFDIFKITLAVLIAYLIKIYFTTFSEIYLGLVGLATIIGHIYPVYFGFRGGKGAACLLGFLIILDWWLLPLGVIVFLLIVKKWKMVSLATLIAPGVWILSALIFHISFFYLNIDVIWNLPLATTEPWWANTCYALGAYGIVILKHWSNIKRLVNHTESRIK